ncbi:MAG: 3-isopropylmalate dehydratase small subunit [Deltaproteobacteria bacterium]|nr:3-isopropylmalate dehydratase small subunit [Deltaproteobacteria bacterium]
MKLSGTALCLGDHIDTDAIIPARFLVSSDPAELAANCMSGLDPEWIKKVTPGASILVAGRNFGCGSSREHAPLAIAAAGIPAVIACSFARIFYRNAFNMGLLPLELGEAAFTFKEGDLVEVDTENRSVSNKSSGQNFFCPPLPPVMQAILDAGGLASFVKKRLQKRDNTVTSAEDDLLSPP